MGSLTDERTSQSDVEQVKERVQDAAQQAKGKTREQLRSQIDTRTTEAGRQISSSADAFRGAADQLRQQGSDRAATVVESVADRGEQLGSYLTGADGDAVLRDVEEFARRQPWLTVGAGVLAGFMAARFMKASSGSRYRTTTQGYPYGGAAAPGYRVDPAQDYGRPATAVPTAGGSGGIG